MYDVRDVLAGIVDDGRLLEVSSAWARNLVCGFARLDGRSVGVIANQPRYLGGVLDAAASEKGARFVSKCDAFGIPLLVLVDTPGYMPGTRQEGAGVIRHGAGLVHAFAQATVPRITLIVRKAFGGAFIAMNSKDLGADYVFAWPGAEIGVMGARPAVGVIHRRELAVAQDPEAERDRLATPVRGGAAAPAGRRRDRIRRRADRAAGNARTAGLGVRDAGGAAMKSGDVLLTGATGFVGMELVARYLERSDRNLITLVRAADDAAAQARMNAVLDDLFGERAGDYRGRVRAVAGDVTTPEPRPDRRDHVTKSPSGSRRSCTRPRRCRSRCRSPKRGRSTSRAPAGCWSWPSSPTGAVGLDCYGQVSTAFVAGDHAGPFAEADLDVGQQFHNSYEQSKFESEQLVAASDLPTRVMRPSIVVGERVSGWTAAFNVRLLAAAGVLTRAVRCDPGGPERTGRRGPDRLRRRRRVRPLRRRRHRRSDLSPDRRPAREHDVGALHDGEPLLPTARRRGW